MAIAPDRRQEEVLARVIPSWQPYARAHGLEIVVLQRSVTDGIHPYWDRWLSIQEGVPDTNSYDEFLLLDNDVYLNNNAPNIFEEWNPEMVNVVEESAQGDWDRAEIPAYYEGFHVTPDARLSNPTQVFNMGVCVISRAQNVTFQLLYRKWLEQVRPRFSNRENEQKDALFRVEADGPFLSYELQAEGLISPLRKEFNYFIIPWLRSHRVRELPFLMQCKLGQKLGGKVPPFLLNRLTGHARRALRSAANECYFLHLAASKSPLWLLPPAGVKTGPHICRPLDQATKEVATKQERDRSHGPR